MLRLIDADHRTFRLKTPWSDGTTHLLLSPLELIEKLAALVPPPPPRLNLVRYHGILAPNARARRLIVPGLSVSTGASAAGVSSVCLCRRRLSWAALLARVFAIARITWRTSFEFPILSSHDINATQLPCGSSTQESSYAMFKTRLIWLGAALALTACSTDPVSPDTSDSEDTTAVGSCNYVNLFSSSSECKWYSGAAWTVESASADCLDGPFGAPGTWVEGADCEVDPTLGSCIVTPDDGMDYTLVVGGDDPRECAAGAQACTAFAGGTFEASTNCAGYDTAPMSSEAAEKTVFQWPTLTCRSALDGEPEGQTDGQVCTWNLISASTEEGRNYVDYGDCGIVHTNRPYYPLDPWQVPPTDDARLDDAEWLAESDWVQTQVRSSACVCCHSEDATPNGPSRWSVDAGPLWVDTMSDEALALFAGHTDSSILGAFDPADNNGFDRVNSALPTTDVDRMLAFFQGELDRRGVTDSYISGLPDVGGPLLLHQAYEPESCGDGEGIDSNGLLIWNGGSARYLYVLEVGSMNPGLPPNLDLPDGTLWRADVLFDMPAFEPGVAYGTLPEGALQRAPAQGTPEVLQSGKQYYLYVLRDIAIPIARCLFTAQ